MTVQASGGTPSVSINVEGGVRCASERRAAQLDLNCQLGRVVPPVHAAAARVLRAAVRDGRQWVGASKPLGAGAPRWAKRMYERSLLTIHALTSKKTGAVAAGARDGWAYVWPRDAATAALALEASGHPTEARRVAKFLTALNLNAAARFTESGAPVPGRAAQGDAAGWVTAAATATGIPAPHEPFPWRDRADYQESSPGTYLGNALAAAAIGNASASRVLHEFGTARIWTELGGASAGDPASGLDSAAGWAVRPFGLAAALSRRRTNPPPPRRRRHALRHHSRRRLAGRRRPVDGPDRLERLVPRRTGRARPRHALGRGRDPERTSPQFVREGVPPRPAPRTRRPQAARRPPPRLDPRRRPPGAGRRPNRHPDLDHSPALVERLRRPRPPRTLALSDQPSVLCRPVGD